MSTYSIDQKTGALRKLSHLELGRNPNWVEIIKLAADTEVIDVRPKAD